MFSRHDLVWLSPDGWRTAEERALPSDRNAFALWQREDWPAIVRRCDHGTADEIISLGMALPPGPQDGRKRRITLHAHRAHVARHMPALPLREAIDAAPACWRDALLDLNARAVAHDLRIYGSLAMQAITGQPHVTSASDIDLLLRPTSVRQLATGIDLLAGHASRLPLDGEVLFPTGDGVSWKEWQLAQANCARVLAKSIDAVRLLEPALLAASLEAT